MTDEQVDAGAEALRRHELQSRGDNIKPWCYLRDDRKRPWRIKAEVVLVAAEAFEVNKAEAVRFLGLSKHDI